MGGVASYEAGNSVYEKCEALEMVCWTLVRIFDAMT